MKPIVSFIVGGIALVAGAAGLRGGTVIAVDSTMGAPGTTALVAVSIETDTNVTTLQFDLFYSSNYFATGVATPGDADSGDFVGANEISPGVTRVLAASFSNTPVTNGVLAYIEFTVAANAPDQDEPLTLTNALLVNPELDEPPALLVPGVFSIVVPPVFSAIYPTNAGAFHLRLLGATGRSYVIEGATDLASPNWVSISTNVAAGGVVEVDDVAAPLPNRFYRAMVGN